MRLPVTALVVTYNEERRLRECLESLSFCAEVLAVDLGSSDGSVAVARECGARVITHPHVPIAEMMMPAIGPVATHDWILRADPDEVYPRGLAPHLERALAESDDTVAAVMLPYQYYFRGRPLTTTVWGGAKYIRGVVHRQRVSWSTAVHSGGFVLAEGMRKWLLPVAPDTVVSHFWIDSYGQLLEKHLRYIRLEGEARFGRGERFTWRKMAGRPARALFEGLVHRRGLFGGPSGVFLSFFYSWYIAMALLSLRRFERSRGTTPA